MEETTIPTSKEHTSGDNIAAYDDSHDTNQALDILRAVDDMREESAERIDGINRAAQELSTGTEDEQDLRSIDAKRIDAIANVQKEIMKLQDYARPMVKKLGAAALADAAEQYARSDGDENNAQNQIKALAYSAVLSPSSIRAHHISLGTIDLMIEKAGHPEISRPKTKVTEVRRVVNEKGDDVETGRVTVGGCQHNPETGEWTVRKLYSNGHLGDEIKVTDDDLVRSIVLGEDGVPTGVTYYRTTEEDPLARNSDEIDRIVNSGDTGKIADNAAGWKDNIINKFEPPKPGTYQGWVELPVGKRN